MRICGLLLPLILLCAAGCGGGSGADPGDGNPMPTVDGATPDSALPLPDSGLPPIGGACACPTLPATCTAPTAGAPYFSPDDEAYMTSLAQTIACATTTLEVAIYQTSWDCIVDLFAAKLAASPSLTLHLAIDDDMCPKSGDTYLCAWSKIATNPRVSIVADNRDAYMHHKFVIADSTRVWTASGNFTQNSVCDEFNNALVLDDPTLVTGFKTTFARFFDEMKFGPLVDPVPSLSAPYSLYFGPQSPTSALPDWYEALLAAVGNATTSIDFMIFAFTRTDLSDALKAAKARGVTIRGVTAPMYANETPPTALRADGIPVRITEVHSKVMIIDGKLVIAGTTNWSANAMDNSEMSLWIDDTAVAAKYEAEFTRIYNAADLP